MNRQEAIELLATEELSCLGQSSRESLLLDWWAIDADDENYHRLPASLRDELVKESGPGDASAPRYDSLLKLALVENFHGVKNAYLQRRLREAGHGDVVVTGENERLSACPCCRYRSLRGRGAFQVCKVCFWEDDGSDALDVISGPNHMTLREGRDNFRQLGAVSSADRPYVLPDGPERYVSDND
jgi:hypothetical protein